ncbi:MAG TPA: DUF4337 domain-containing protein [Bacteroidia bacterium]|jgi:hypothetical protein|nr:DUF4337 domain-containing protein [Bacteroidia bacterium]
MADEQKEKWLNYLSVTTIIIAVCATLSTFKGGGYSTRSLLNQTRASDQWAFFQAKGIKQYLYEIEADNLQAQLDANADKSQTASIQKRLDGYKDKIKKYTKDKEDITKEAKALEEVRDESKKHSDAFGLAVIFLQVSILLSSIAALLKKKPIWYLSMALGAAGIAYFVNGFFLLF